MGNCLEISESDILRARRAKALKLMAIKHGYVGPNGYPHPPPGALFPQLVPDYSRDMLASHYVAVDVNSGQHYFVRNSHGPFGIPIRSRIGPHSFTTMPSGHFPEEPNDGESPSVSRQGTRSHGSRKSSVKKETDLEDGKENSRRNSVWTFSNLDGVMNFPEEPYVIVDYVDTDPKTVTVQDKIDPTIETVSTTQPEQVNPTIVASSTSTIKTNSEPEETYATISDTPIKQPAVNYADVELESKQSSTEVSPLPPIPFPPPPSQFISSDSLPSPPLPSPPSFSPLSSPPPSWVPEPEFTTKKPKVNFMAVAAVIENDNGGVVDNGDGEIDAVDSLTQPSPVDTQEDTQGQLPEMLKDSLTIPQPTVMESTYVVITYSVLAEYELGIVGKLTRQLKATGLSVWAERLGDSSRARKSDNTAEAILSCKALIVLLSEGSCEQRFIRDHVGIATMLNIPIFPVSTEPPSDVLDAMPQELRVHLSQCPWTELKDSNSDSFLFQLRSLARSVEDEIDEYQNNSKRWVKRRSSRQEKSSGSSGQYLVASKFWDVHFGHRDNVKWERLVGTIEQFYKNSLNSLLPNQLKDMLTRAMMNRMVNNQQANADIASLVVYRDHFISICKTADGADVDVWDTIVQVASVMQAVRDVFEKISTVQQLAVDNTERFNNPTVLAAFRDLASDPDADLRAITVVSLSRCLAQQEVQESFQFPEADLALQDADSRVREAGCLAFGHLKLTTAVDKLQDVWNNDTDDTVRQTAKMAIDQIQGSDDATGADESVNEPLET